MIADNANFGAKKSRGKRRRAGKGTSGENSSKTDAGLLFFQQQACNYRPLNLAGAFADSAQLHIAVKLFGEIV
jgi:hypothetical protein